MNDDPLAISKPVDSGEVVTQTDQAEQSHNVAAAPAVLDPRDNAPSPVIAHINGTPINRSNGNSAMDKSDSEAETVVLSGKEEGEEQMTRKAIKLEEASVADPVANGPSDNLPTIREDQREGRRENNGRKPSLKRKRTIPTNGSGDIPDTGNSSNLSSTISSPVQAVHSSKATESASDRSRSSPPFEEVAPQLEERAKKQRSGSDSGHSRHQAGKSDREAGLANSRKRRETRSATHYDGPAHRSESPPARNNHRAQSIQSTISQPNGVTKRRKVPAPLHVERRRKASEDTHPDSDDSSSVHSRHHLQKITSADGHAMSLAKMPISSKKNRDRSGRTLLARACAQDACEAEKWLKERPQDIDVPDNAGNTPLQIAALEGDVEVVQLLLNAGCDTTSKNIDKDTPLIDAVENGHLEVVRLLLKAGLDPRQKNAKGQEPLELIPAEDEEAEDIRETLMASKREKERLRRPSEDHHRHSTGSRDVEISSTGASGASPTRSPPPPALGVRRRTARSQPTDDALLWVNPTPERLRDAAGKGDLTIVDHILKMRPKVDTEAVLAAARGGHDGVLNLMMAIGNLDPDPEPLRSGEYKPAYSTPMLAAIGRGNISVIQLLLSQPGFDPTRRRFKDLTYYEISKERQGSEWQEENDILKEAYDNYRPNGGRRSNNNSPRKVRPKRADSNKHSSEPSSSPHDSRKVRKTKPSPDDDPMEGVRKDSSHKGTGSRHLGDDLKKQQDSAILSDRDSDALGLPKPKHKERKSNSDIARPAINRADSLKPKRRLMSGNDFKTDQDLKQRANQVAEARDDSTRRKSGDSISGRQRKSSDASESTAKISKASSEEPTNVKSELGKKRHRMSVSPRASKTDLPGTTEAVRKKKRRVDSQGNAIDQDRDRSFRPGPAMVANMIVSPTAGPSPTVSQGTAPVAFMGSNTASPVTKSPTESRIHSTLISPVNSIDQALSQQQQPDLDDMRAQRQVEEDLLRQERLDRERERQAAQEEKERLEEIESEKRRQAEAELERKARAEVEEAERKARVARDEEDARLEAQRQAEEDQRQQQMEREEEENRIAKKKRDEEMQQRKMEQDRLRKENEERKRREFEERESKRRMQAQEEAERLRRQSLPNGLRRAAELSLEDARTAKEVAKWLPLRTVTTQELNPGCEPQMAEERWIANIQAAPMLAIKDLELSQYTAWTRFPATMNHQGSLWRQLRNPMSQAIPPSLLSPTEVYNFDEETRPKFFDLKHVFWIKLSEFMDIVPRHQHLAGIKLGTRAMVLHEFPFGRGATWDRPGVSGGEEVVKQEAAASPIMNGNMTNGHR
ncbi:hypothetical protein HO173_004661 [Letharia columbiana]|uniref:Uncharacterized protein n=1 Tax=Letharia columbiana TaxID=112416 RepID=A0A8H6L681_9LECA|nr:uncharacterized protein HO173_004661 [Letharia columbiana]KAF6237193.1 hypothetical protein HO173_004661 [Letharia columbiana]